MSEKCHNCGKEFEIINGGVLFEPNGETCSPFTVLIALCEDCRDNEKYADILP